MTKGKISKILSGYGGKVGMTFENRVLTLSGQLDSYEEVVALCKRLASNTKRYTLVNDITVAGLPPVQMRLPNVADNVLDGERCDVLVIGAGVCGTAIARELSRLDLSVLLIDKESDVALHASSRNDGEVHPGIDLKRRQLKFKYNLAGNKMFDQLESELNVGFKRNGQYVIIKKWRYLVPLYVFALIKRIMGIPARVLLKKQLLQREPNASKQAVAALFTPTAGVVCPYGLCIAYAENAIDNGAQVCVNTAVVGMQVINNKIKTVQTNRGWIYPELVVNAAGVFAERVAQLAEDRFYSIHPRKGTNAILDKKAGFLTNAILGGHRTSEVRNAQTKGGGVVRTTDDNILIGPDALEVRELEDFSTNRDSIDAHVNKFKQLTDGLSGGDVINYFSGTRAPTYEEDFVVERGRNTKNLIHCAGIQSPGLTAAPAIAVEVAGMVKEMLGAREKSVFNPYRPKRVPLREMTNEQKQELILQDPDYGEIICRCEQISKGEILDCMRRARLGLPVQSVDAIKKRLRPGMGRCQGGFCSPLVAKLIAEFYDIPLERVNLKNPNSNITYGDTKGEK